MDVEVASMIYYQLCLIVFFLFCWYFFPVFCFVLFFFLFPFINYQKLLNALSFCTGLQEGLCQRRAVLWHFTNLVWTNHLPYVYRILYYPRFLISRRQRPRTQLVNLHWIVGWYKENYPAQKIPEMFLLKSFGEFIYGNIPEENFTVDWKAPRYLFLL